MSYLNVNQVSTAAGLPSFTTGANTINFGTQSIGASSAATMKNRIINGAMVIDQRNAGASSGANISGINTYTLDRWAYYSTQASKFTVQQNAGSVTPPAGFTNYLGVTSSSAYTPSSSDLIIIDHQIEGFNIADLGWGTANAKTVSLSFWVYSSLTGTFGGTIQNSAQTRAYGFTYTVSSANTWTAISIVIPGDTSGTWLTNNSRGIGINLNLGCGSTFNASSSGSWLTGAYFGVSGTTNMVSTNGATLYITGVQLEVGTVATSFDYRHYGTELALCQRYCYAMRSPDQAYYRFPTGYTSSTSQAVTAVLFPIVMRTTPSLTQSTSWQEIVASGSATGTSITISTDGNSPFGATIDFNASGGSYSAASLLSTVRISNSTSWYIIFSAEV